MSSSSRRRKAPGTISPTCTTQQLRAPCRTGDGLDWSYPATAAAGVAKPCQLGSRLAHMGQHSNRELVARTGDSARGVLPKAGSFVHDTMATRR